MSGIVVRKNEVAGYWGVYFCDGGKVEMHGCGYPSKEDAVAFAEHVKRSSSQVVVEPTIDELEAMVEWLKKKNGVG